MRAARSASRVFVAMLTTQALLLGACSSGDADGAAAELAAAAAPEVPAPPRFPPPSAVPAAPAEPGSAPEPTIERLFRTVPGVSWDPDQPIRNASFQRFDSDRHREVGQTVRIVEPIELHQIVLWFELATIALPGFRDYPDGTNFDILRNFVQMLPPQDDLPISLSLVIYRSPDPDLPSRRTVSRSSG
jgi:hypothetical protein